MNACVLRYVFVWAGRWVGWAGPLACEAATPQLPMARPPFEWRHANLGPVFLFLLKEIEDGRFVPAFDFP